MRMKIGSIVGALAIGLALMPSIARADVIDFDSVVAPCCYLFVTPGGAQGPMLSFPDIDLDGGVILDGPSGWAGLQTSDPNLYGTSDFIPLADGSLLPGFITGTVSAPGVFSMIEMDIINGFSASTFTLTAFDAAMAVVDSDTIALASFAGGVGHVSVSGAGIKSFTVTSGQGAGSIDFAIDSLILTRGTAVPEPGSIAMIACSSVGLLMLIRRRRTRA